MRCACSDGGSCRGPDAGRELIPPPSWAYNDLACAPAIVRERQTAANAPPLRVVGSQDDSIRDLLGPGDVLVVSGGSNAGLQTGQRYFVRRITRSKADGELPATIHTAGGSDHGVDTTVATVICPRATAFYGCIRAVVEPECGQTDVGELPRTDMGTS